MGSEMCIRDRPGTGHSGRDSQEPQGQDWSGVQGWDELLLCDGEKEESVKEGGIKKENGILLLILTGMC